jgi:hypothetical protein
MQILIIANAVWGLKPEQANEIRQYQKGLGFLAANRSTPVGIKYDSSFFTTLGLLRHTASVKTAWRIALRTRINAMAMRSSSEAQSPAFRFMQYSSFDPILLQHVLPYLSLSSCVSPPATDHLSTVRFGQLAGWPEQAERFLNLKPCQFCCAIKI